MSYIRNVLIAVDQLANALIGGWPDETLSSCAYRMQIEGYFWGFTRRIIDAIFFFEPNHCEEAFYAERRRTQAPPESR